MATARDNNKFKPLEALEEDNLAFNESNLEDEKKRKRENSSMSSCPDIDSSLNTSQLSESETKRGKQKKKKSKVEEKGSSKEKTDYKAQELSTIMEHIKSMNTKLENTMTKNEKNLRQMIEEIVNKTKNELLKSMEMKIDVLEGKLFEKQQESDNLKKSIEKLTEKLDKAETENQQLKAKLIKNQEMAEEKLNDLEQYSRRNNIRIDGIVDKERESAKETVDIVIEKLNAKIPELKITVSDIDTAHRLGQFAKDRKRSIIVKFQSRLTKQHILRNKKVLHSDRIFINEDLTKMNRAVLQSVRLKQKDFIQAAWSREGIIYYRDVNEMIQPVRYKNFKYWLDIPWPERSNTAQR